MIVNIDWLKDYVEFDLTPEDLVDILTNIGLESEVREDGKTIEIDLTPNRPDCMSHIGVAREISVITGLPLKIPISDLTEVDDPVRNYVSVEILDPVKCPRYACRIVKNIKFKPSPKWMAERLESIGIRSINNIVDISNYVMMEWGHPLHTFDLEEIKGQKIIVRAAADGESFTTLDEIERKLNKRHLLICDTERGVALAGIMGGKNSEIMDSTKDVLIEGAYFDPITIRRGSKAVGLSTESSKRFERGADPEGAIHGINRIAELLSKYADGDICSGIADVYPKPLKRESIDFRPSRAASIAGVNFSPDFLEKTFNNLGITITHKKSDLYCCVPPTYRPDLEREIDLIEELARIYGYDQIQPETSYQGLLSQVQQDPKYYIDRLKQIFAGIGFQEIFSNSLIRENRASQFADGLPVRVQNPQSMEMSTMRSSLFPGLLSAVSFNLNRGAKSLRLFEFGNTFITDLSQPHGIDEREEFAGIIYGEQYPKQWRHKKSEADFFMLKGYMESLARQLKLEEYKYLSNSDSLFELGQSLATSDSKVVVEFGMLQQSVVQSYDIDELIFAFSLNVPLIKKIIKTKKSYQPVSMYPGITRDLSFVVNSSVLVKDFMTIFKGVSGDLLDLVSLFDVFEGGSIGEGKKSLTFNFFFQRKERTLKDEEVDEIINKIILETSKILSAKLR